MHKAKNWQYTAYICEQSLSSDINNEDLWNAFSESVINLGDQGWLKKCGSYGSFLLFKLTKQRKWLIRAFRWNFKSRQTLFQLISTTNLPIQLLLTKLLYEIHGKQMKDGVLLCKSLLTIKNTEAAIKTGEEMLEKFGECAEILNVLQAASLTQKNQTA